MNRLPQEHYELALKTLISANDHLFNCEEMLRKGFVIHKEKNLTNRMVKTLIDKVTAHEKIDNKVDAFETLIMSNRKFIDACASVPLVLREVVAGSIHRDILNIDKTPIGIKIDLLFDEIVRDKSIDKRSQITQLKNNLKQLIK